jgi:glycosyltransferase involved in cell wall biosynthesis
MPIRIEYFIDHLKVGGAQRHLVELFSTLDRTRFSPQVCVAKGGGALIPVLEEMGIPVRVFGVTGTLARPATVGALVRTARRLRADGVQIVHGYLYEGNAIGMLAGRLARVPILIASKRSLDRYPRRSQRTVTRLANAFADRIVCNADEVRRFVLGEERPLARKLMVIPNGIRIEERMPAPERPAGVAPGVRLVGTIGRLSWKKAYPDFLAMAARVRAVHDDVEFVMIGDGPLRAELEAEAERLGVRPYVHFLGEVHGVRALLRGLDLFVITSVIEGMPNVVLEALAVERPVVATAVGGIPEIIADGQSGLLVPPSDPAALTAACLRLLEDPSGAAALGAEGRRTVLSRFSVGAMTARYSALYDALATAAGLAGAGATNGRARLAS